MAAPALDTLPTIADEAVEAPAPPELTHHTPTHHGLPPGRGGPPGGWVSVFQALPSWAGILLVFLLVFTPVGRAAVGLPEQGRQAASSEEIERVVAGVVHKETESLRAEAEALRGETQRLNILLAQKSQQVEDLKDQVKALKTEFREEMRALRGRRR